MQTSAVRDVDESNLPQEVGRTAQTVSFTKGCYLGQEIVERVRSRGQVHRVLMPLQMDVAEPPAPGTKLQIDGKDAAEITSAAFSPALNKVVALAYVRTEFADRTVFSPSFEAVAKPT